MSGERGFDYDLVVVGAGPAGEKGAVQAAYFGSLSRSTIATRLPKYAAWTAPFSPAGPPPNTTRSKSYATSRAYHLPSRRNPEKNPRS